MSGTLEIADRPHETVGSFWRGIAARLRSGRHAAQGDVGPHQTSALDARLIVAHALGIDVGSLAFRDHDPVSSEARKTASAMMMRRANGEPVARIVGEKEFWSLPFRLSRGTLVPRPDTETLVSVAIDAIAEAGLQSEPLRILDLGTGSGCILLAMLSELPESTGLGVDCADDAVTTASENARRLGLAERTEFAIGNWAHEVVGQFDVILANPPYIEDEVLPRLPVEVVGFDPHAALSGGPDGLDSYRQIVPQLPALLAKSGFAVLEVGPQQAPNVAEIAAGVGFVASVTSDLAGCERAVSLTIS